MAFLSRFGARLALNSTRRLTVSAVRSSAVAVPLSREELQVQWVEYFDDECCDYFYFRKGAYDLFKDDFVADPKVYQVGNLLIYHNKKITRSFF